MFRLKIFFLLFTACIIIDAEAQDYRVVQDFNNDWEFVKHDIANQNNDWENVHLPHTYNNNDMQISKNYYTGDATYRKIFTIPENAKGQRIFLKFEGVGSVAKIYLNGKYVTQHKGAYTAFAFEITNMLHIGKSDTLLVKVNNTARKDVIPVNMFLFPIYGGIYRSVEMIFTPKINFTVTDYASPGIYIKQKTNNTHAEVYTFAKIENKELEPKKIIVRSTIVNKDGATVSNSERTYMISPQGFLFAHDTMQVDNPHLWNGVDDPYLYTIKTTISKEGKIIDEIDQPLGLRFIELKAGDGVYLNGKKYRMYGVSRHQDWQGFGDALSNDQHRSDFLTIREMGATTVRLAHYPQADYVYRLADSLGLLIWSEIPFVNATSFDESENAHEKLKEMIRQMMNHPSVFMWGLHNEVYSSNKDAHVPILTRELNDIAKTEDPDRPTIATSGYGEIDRPSNLAADVQGINRYYGWYEGKIADLNNWGSYLKEKFPTYKVMLAEYGADGNIDQHCDTLPTAASIDPVKGQYYPENYQTETHVQQWVAIQNHPNILASYVWNMFEFAVPAWSRGGVPARNLKGLITFDRKRKKDAFYWYKANWNPNPMVYLAGRRDSVRSRAIATIEVFSNVKDPTIYLNGKSIPTHRGVNDKQWIADVKLKPGKNYIEVKASTSKKEILMDHMQWFYNNK